MKFLVTGGGGYIGSILVEMILDAGHSVDVFDRFYFGDAKFVRLAAEGKPLRLIRGDMRAISVSVVQGHDVVVDLAGLSNDPSADLSSRLTEEINYSAAIRLAHLAREAGVPRLVYASSCSIYGEADGAGVRNEDAELRPVSLYAKVKARVDTELRAMASPSFIVTTLRNATVYGVSSRMRFDLVVNMMTLHAFRDRRIFILGGGHQWRPLVHLKDVSQAFLLAAEAPASVVNGQAFNIGDNDQNYEVITIAGRVAALVPNTQIERVPDDRDKRSYRVGFDKAKNALGFKPQFSVDDGIRETLNALQTGLVEESIKTRTVEYYRYLIDAEQIVKSLSIDGSVI